MKCMLSIWMTFVAIVTAGSACSMAKAGDVVAQSGVKGGLVVHLGCGDGRETAALHANEGYLVQGLDIDPETIARARDHIRSRGLYGRISVDCFDGRHLPYVDNLVNLLIAGNSGNVPHEEILRVLAPGGVAMIGGRKTVKPRPAGIDDWTHYLHGPDNNAVARDKTVGPPREVQWTVGPTWARHHDVQASVSAMVCSGNRVFYIIDEAPSALMHLPSQWNLVARDAFNGILLWRRAIGKWVSPYRAFRTGPNHLPRRLVAIGDRVYVTLGYGEPISVLDAATGKTERTYAGTEGAEDIICHDDLLLLIVDSNNTANESNLGSVKKRLLALSQKSGKVLWEETGPVVAQSVAAIGNRVCWYSGEEVICVDRTSGKEKWRAPAVMSEELKLELWYAPTLVMTEKAVLLSDGKEIRAFAMETGKVLWKASTSPGFKSAPDVFVIQGLVWYYRMEGSRKGGSRLFEARDLLSGEVKRAIQVDKIWTGGHHHRCYRNKATVRYLITSKRGLEYIDVEGDGHARNNWVRGGCQFGIMPCNGLTYVTPQPCSCFPAAKLNGFYVLAPRRTQGDAVLPKERLERGPGYAQARKLIPSRIVPWKAEPRSKKEIWRTDGITLNEDWPTFRHDPARSGSTPTKLPEKMELLWRTELEGTGCAPVAAKGRAFVPLSDQHAVQALDAVTGKELWLYQTGGKVDSPPTIYGDLAVFGSADGSVYCVRCDTGELVWRFLVARRDRRVVCRGQVESAWPLPGSVLISPGGVDGKSPLVYAAAGRSGHLDDGIQVCAIDLITGKERYRTAAACPYQVGPEQTVRSAAFAMEGILADVLVANGSGFCMRQTTFNEKCEIVPDETRRALFATNGLLSDEINYRYFWILGESTRRANLKLIIPDSTGKAPYAKMLVFHADRAYGFRVGYDIKGRFKASPRGGLVFASLNDAFSTTGKKAPKAAKSAWKGAKHPRFYLWSFNTPLQVRAMLLASDRLLIAGWTDAKGVPPNEEGVLSIVSAEQGKKLSDIKLAAPPVWDGMIASRGRLYLVDQEGGVACFGKGR